MSTSTPQVKYYDINEEAARRAREMNSFARTFYPGEEDTIPHEGMSWYYPYAVIAEWYGFDSVNFTNTPISRYDTKP